MKHKKIEFFGLSARDIALWVVSMLIILISYVIFGGEGYLTLAASLIGATSLIFCAKGNPFGQILMILFSTFYGLISFECKYYGEMITYLGMTAPMAAISLISWLRNPYKGNKREVEVNKISKREWVFLLFLTVAVTFVFHYILKALGTASIFMSTVSVATSFLAAYLTFRRSEYFALGYAANDVVLIILWIIASLDSLSYLSVTVCFIIFLANDLYGFINWRVMRKRQIKARRTDGAAL